MTSEDYAAKMAARAERTQRRAEALRAEANRRYAAAMAAIERIEPGQPILVDHYSAARHRRDLARHDRHMRAAIAAQAEAKRLAAIRPSTAISADDPDAAAKLTSKAEAIHESVERMKAVNAAYRKAGKPAPDDTAGWEAVARLAGCELVALRECRLSLARSPYYGQPYPAFTLTNARARQRQAEQRARQVASRPTTGQTLDAGNGITVESCPDDNRLRITFPGKPDAATIAQLKRHGFRWSPSVGAWQRQWTNAAVYAVRQMFPTLTSIEG